MNFYQVLMVLCPLDPDPHIFADPDPDSDPDTKHLGKEQRKGN